MQKLDYLKSLLVLFILLSAMSCAGPKTAIEKPIEGTQGIQRTHEIIPKNIDFEMSSGKITYTLPEPALVRIRIGIDNGGPLLHTLVDWEPRKAGKNIEVWDKKDATKSIDFSGYLGLSVAFSCLPLDPFLRDQYKGVVHGKQKSPDFDVSLPKSTKDSENEVWIVSGKTPIRIILSEKDKKRLTESKYEFTIFIDHLFLVEDEEGVSPFTYLLDTQKYNNGEHVLTINIASYAGEVGARSVPLFVRNDNQK